MGGCRNKCWSVFVGLSNTEYNGTSNVERSGVGHPRVYLSSGK